MTFFSKIASAALILCGSLFAQGVLMQLPPVTNSIGNPIAGATISVFTATGPTTALVCTTPVTVYSDVALSVPITTLQTDGFGNFPFFIAASANPYGYTVTGAGTNTTQCYGFSSPIAPNTTATLKSLNTIRFADQYSGSDMCAKILAAYSDCSATGCEVRVPAGTYTCTTQLVIPNDGGTPNAHQKTLKLVGAGAGGLGDFYTASPSGTVLNMTFNATSGGKIQTTGLGQLEVTGITFEDTATDGSPFVFTTNTDLHFHDNQFYGGGQCSGGANPPATGGIQGNTAGLNDVFILGGTTDTTGNLLTSAFQGYGTVITANTADCINRFAVLNHFANAIAITDNKILGSSGTSTHALFEIGQASSQVSGNKISGNLCEMFHAKYCVNLVGGAFFNLIESNSCYDAGVNATSCIHVTNAANNSANQIIDANVAIASIPSIDGNGRGGGVQSVNNQCAVHGTNTGTATDYCIIGVASNVGYAQNTDMTSALASVLANGTNNRVTQLNNTGVTGTLTGNAADQTLYSYTVAGNQLAAGRGFRVKITHLHLTGTASTAIKLKVGATTLFTLTYTPQAANSQIEEIDLDFFNNPGVQNAQWFSSHAHIFDTATPSSGRDAYFAGTAALDMTASQTFLMTVNVANTDTFIGKGMTFELVQ